MSINRAIISGNLTRDAELRTTASGMDVLTFSVAVNDRRKNQRTGEWEDYANFVDCKCFGNRASFLANRLTKGTKVAVEGKLSYSCWDKDGQRHTRLEIIADEVESMTRQEPVAVDDDLPF